MNQRRNLKLFVILIIALFAAGTYFALLRRPAPQGVTQDVTRDDTIVAFIQSQKRGEQAAGKYEVVMKYSPDLGGKVGADHAAMFVSYLYETEEGENRNIIEPFLILRDHVQRGPEQGPLYFVDGDKVVVIQNWVLQAGDPKIVFYDHGSRQKVEDNNFEKWKGTKEIPVPEGFLTYFEHFQYPFIIAIIKDGPFFDTRERTQKLFIYNIATGKQKIVDIQQGYQTSITSMFFEGEVVFWSESGAVGGREGYKRRVDLGLTTSDPSPTPTPAIDISFLETRPIDTTNWKTYRSEKYDFEIQYPEKWVVGVQTIDAENTDLIFESQEQFPPRRLTLVYIKNDNRLTDLDNLASEPNLPAIGGYKSVIKEEKLSKGQPFIFFAYTRRIGYGRADGLEFIMSYPFEGGEKVIEDSDQILTDADKQLFITFLSTMKFDEIGLEKAKPAIEVGDDDRQRSLRRFQGALELYFDDNQVYPENVSLSALKDAENYHYSLGPDKKSYHIGVTLEGGTHQGLQSDDDFSSLKAGWINGFSGSDDKKCGAEDIGMACYDVYVGPLPGS